MRTRRIYYHHYGMSKECVEWLKEYCRTTEDLTLVNEAAQESGEWLKDVLVKSVVENKSYVKLCDEVDYIPCGKEDFYGYQRKTLFLLKEKILKNDNELREYFIENGVIRRYCDLKEIARELNVSCYCARKLSENAGALYKIGALCRVDMNKLYEYMEKECLIRKTY